MGYSNENSKHAYPKQDLNQSTHIITQRTKFNFLVTRFSSAINKHQGRYVKS